MDCYRRRKLEMEFNNPARTARYSTLFDAIASINTNANLDENYRLRLNILKNWWARANAIHCKYWWNGMETCGPFSLLHRELATFFSAQNLAIYQIKHQAVSSCSNERLHYLWLVFSWQLMYFLILIITNQTENLLAMSMLSFYNPMIVFNACVKATEAIEPPCVRAKSIQPHAKAKK